MIQRTIPTWQSISWQEELSSLITDPAELLDRLELPKSLLESAQKANKLFPLRVTQSYASRIKPGDIDDPLLKQVLPLGAELTSPASYTADPLAEQSFNPAPGVIHKYHGRVLLISASQCAINCRYCFRRHFDYQANTPSRAEWQEALRYIADNESIDEVILSGGDPLAVSDKQMQWLVDQIAAIPHVTRLRIHTRLPVVLPNRITSELVDTLVKTRLQCVIVVHVNHAAEIDEHVHNRLKILKKANITLLNQSVLLKGVNDSASCLVSLSKRLFSCGILPYYLHLLDKVTGAAHFDVDEASAIALHNHLLAALPGYLVPKLVREVPNAASKTAVYGAEHNLGYTNN